MRHLMLRIKAPTVLLMLLLLNIGGVNRVKAAPVSFGTNSTSTYELTDATVTITLKEAGDLAYLTDDFSNVRFVKFVTDVGVKMNAADFAKLNLFGTVKSVTLDFTNADIAEGARSSAVLNGNGVVIGTERYKDPQTVYALYNSSQRDKINAMINFVDRNQDGKLNTLEAYIEEETAAPTLAGLKELIRYQLEEYNDIDDVVIFGAAFQNSTANAWLETTCQAYEDEPNVTSFRVSEYTIEANNTLTLTNSNITSVDFSYLWDSGNKQTATLDLSGLANLEQADLRACNLKEIDLKNLSHLTEIDITAINPNTIIDLTGCSNNITIKGGELFVAAGGTIISGSSNYTLAADTEVQQEWSDAVDFGTNGSSYKFAYEQTVVQFTVKAAGDIATLANDDTFSRARVVQIITDGASLNDADLANLKVFGKKGDVNIDFTYASVDGNWTNAIYSDNNVLILTPGAVDPRKFYRNTLKWQGDYAKVKAVANIYDSNEDGLKNTIELYGAQGEWGGYSPIMTLYRRLLRLYPNVHELVVYGGETQYGLNIADNIDWLEGLSVQLSGITEITSLVVFSYNCGTNDIVIKNPNLISIDLSNTINVGKIDITGCPALKSAFFAGVQAVSFVDISGLTALEELNFTNTTGITLTVGVDDDLSEVTIYGCENLSNHSSLPEHICAGDYKLPYEVDPMTDLDITIDLDRGRQWTKYGNPNSLRQLLKMIRVDLLRKGNEYINSADPNYRYNYVKIKGALKPKNMGALNMYVSGDSFEEDEENPLTIDDKFAEGDIVCRYLDLSEATPVKDEATPLRDADGNYILNENGTYKYDSSDILSWYQLLRSAKRTAGEGTPDAVGLGVHTAAVDYVILPKGLDKSVINAETFDGFLALKAAGSVSDMDDSGSNKSLVAYVKEPGTLYGLTGYLRELSTKDMTGSFYVCNDRDGAVHINTSAESGESTGYKHWQWYPEPDKLKKVVLSGDINALDIARNLNTGYYINDGHLVQGTFTEPSLAELGINEGYDSYYIIKSIEMAKLQCGIEGALRGAYLMELDLIDANVIEYDDNGDITDEHVNDLLFINLNVFRDGNKSSFSIAKYKESGLQLFLPKNTKTLPEDFLNNKSGFFEFCLPYSVENISAAAFYGTSLKHLYTTDGDGNIIDKAGIYTGTYTTGGIERVENAPTITDATAESETYTGKVDGVYTFSANLKKIETAAFSTVGVGDVYVLATTAPICEVDAFNSATYCSNNAYTRPEEGTGITRSDYNSNGGMAVLHYPAEATVENKKKYTDITREYSITDRDGRLDGNGKTIMWPNQQEFNRAYAQGRTGYLWKAWDTTRDTNYSFLTNAGYSTGETVAEAQVNADDVYDTNTYATKINEIFYDIDNFDAEGTAITEDNNSNLFDEDYRGWHQFVLTEAAGDGPQKFAFDWIVDNNWWTICIPFDMTLGDLRTVFGHTDDDKEYFPIVSQLTKVIRSKNGGTMKEEGTEFKLGENTVLLYFCDDLVKKAMTRKDIQVPCYDGSGSIIRENGDVQTETTDDESKRNSQIVIQAGQPYLIKPYMRMDGNTPAETAFMEMNENLDSSVFDFETRKKNLYFGQRDVRAIDLDGDKQTDSNEYTYTFSGCYSGWYYPTYSFYLGVSSSTPSGVAIKRLTSTPKVSGNRSWRSYSSVILVNWGVTGGATLNEESLDTRETKRTVKTDAFTAGGTTHWVMWTGTNGASSVSTDDRFSTGQQTAKNNIVVSFGDFSEGSNNPAKIDGVEISPDSNITVITRQKVYNLNGQLVSNDGSLKDLSRGCYILNGKKYVVK